MREIVGVNWKEDVVVPGGEVVEEVTVEEVEGVVEVGGSAGVW